MYSPLKLKEFTPVSEGLSKVIKGLEGKNNKIYFALMFHWQAIVGENIAEISFPLKLQSGKKENLLYISCVPEHITEASYSRDIIIEKIAFHFGYRAVDKVKFVQKQS